MSATPAISQLAQYPRDELRMGRGLLIAVGVHLFLGALICLILYLLGIVSLKELLEKGGSIASSGPAPQQPMIIELKLDKILPPPTDHIEFIKQILKPKEIPKPIPKPTPIQKIVTAIKHEIAKVLPKRFTAPKATGSGNSSSVSGFIKGSSGFPYPNYPYDALQAGEGGTVQMHVVFDAGGGVASADIVSSSGIIELDTSTRNFIYGHWKNASVANQSVNVSIIYDPRGFVH
jgi:TonB family protein